jgi:ABC-type branched-subunit amino acid transport system permease subunit
MSVNRNVNKPDRSIHPLLILAAAALLVLPLVLGQRYLLRVMINIFFFAALGSAWNIIGGFAGQLSLGHAAFVAMGAYPTALLLKNFNVAPWLGVLPGIVLAMVVASGIGKAVLKLRGPYLALSTLAFGEIVRILLLHFKDLTQGSLGVSIPFKGNNWWTLQFATEHVNYVICLGLLVLIVYIANRIHNSRMGYYLQAIKEDQDAAESLGVPLARIKNRALTISAGLTAAMGAFYVIYQSYIDPYAVCGLDLSIEILLVAIIGGVGTVSGPVIGAIVLIPLMEISNFILGGGRAGASWIIYAVMLIVVVLYSPKGLATLVPKLDSDRSE